ncbi:MAG: DsbA family protein [Gammaproteobacteria bacterium]|nr:DsbA family protein [Gammaproteobacteria bacterium]MDH3769141.1 DsbA family protein [Gammaproteobacteria bacterium]
MKILVGLLLALSITLPACSAEDSSSAVGDPVVTIESTPDPVTSISADIQTAVNTEPEAEVLPEPEVEVVPPEPEIEAVEVLPEPVVEPAAITTPAPVVVTQAPEPTPLARVAAPAERSDIVAGKHYRVLTPAQPTSSSPDKVEVAEVFMYSCPHCMDFEPFVADFLKTKPAYVSFVRIPASFNSTARMHTKAYYMAETLGILEDVHADFFDEYHNASNRLSNEKSITDFFAKHGVDNDTVASAFNSFAVDTKIRQADNLSRRYGIDSVPSLVINGKYVTSGSMTGSTRKLREVVDYLAAKEASQM